MVEFYERLSMLLRCDFLRGPRCQRDNLVFFLILMFLRTGCAETLIVDAPSQASTHVRGSQRRHHQPSIPLRFPDWGTFAFNELF